MLQLAYYKYIIETFHPSDPVHICTENHGAADGKAGGNPVVAALLAWRPAQITMPPGSLADDAAILLGARFLVEATSSFSWVMAAMNPRLERVYRPIYGRFRPDGTPMGPARGVNKNECGCCAMGFPNEGRMATAVVELTMQEYRPFVTNGARYGKDKVKNAFVDRARAMLSYAGPIEPAEMPLPPPTAGA